MMFYVCVAYLERPRDPPAYEAGGPARFPLIHRLAGRRAAPEGSRAWRLLTNRFVKLFSDGHISML